MSRSLEEQLAALERQQKALAERKKTLQKRASEAERKARTRRLIQEGGALEAALAAAGLTDLTPDDLPILTKYYTQYAGAIKARILQDRARRTAATQQAAPAPAQQTTQQGLPDDFWDQSKSQSPFV